MEKSTKFRKPNVLDIVILIVLIFCVFSIVFRYRQQSEIADGALSGKYEISFTVTNVKYSTADAFVAGDEVYVATDDTYIGIFDRIDSNTPAVYYAPDPDRTTPLYYPEGTRVDITGTIISEGVMNEDGFFVGGSYFLAPGKKVTFYTGHIFVDAVLGEIKEQVG